MRMIGYILGFFQKNTPSVYSIYLFQELCARPLWTNDYLKMTQVFHTVLIRNIPILSQKNRSEARRFICLIDTLYDHKLRVVASGAAPYWELFQVSLSKYFNIPDSQFILE